MLRSGQQYVLYSYVKLLIRHGSQESRRVLHWCLTAILLIEKIVDCEDFVPSHPSMSVHGVLTTPHNSPYGSRLGCRMYSTGLLKCTDC